MNQDPYLDSQITRIITRYDTRNNHFYRSFVCITKMLIQLELEFKLSEDRNKSTHLRRVFARPYLSRRHHRLSNVKHPRSFVIASSCYFPYLSIPPNKASLNRASRIACLIALTIDWLNIHLLYSLSVKFLKVVPNLGDETFAYVVYQPQ